MDNASGSDPHANQSVNPSNSYENLSIQELTDRLRQSFEREYERSNPHSHRRIRRSRPQAPDQPSNQIQQDQQQTDESEAIWQPLPRTPALLFQQHTNSTGRLLILAILIAKEDNPEGTPSQVWEAFVYKLQTTPLFNSEAQVLQAWWHVFETPHRPMFYSLVTGTVAQVYQKVTRLVLPYPLSHGGY